MLARDEEEKLQDCMLLVQSAQKTLATVDRQLIPNIEEIEQCFHSADRALRLALTS